MNAQLRVFAFEDPVEYLNYELKERQRVDKRFSIREWARQIGYANPSYLSEVLRRERQLTVDLASKLAISLGLEGKAYRYFELTVLLQRTLSDREKEFYSQLLKSLRPANFPSMNEVSLDVFSLISDWYHWAIIEMTDLKGFDSSEAYIRKRLVAPVEAKAVRIALERLVKHGFLSRDAEGNLRRASQRANITDPKVAALAVREYQRQMAKRGLEALNDQISGEIDYQGSTIRFKKERIAEARQIMRQAHQALLALGEKEGEGEEVYQLNTQFFRLTRPAEAKRGRKSRVR